MFGHGPGQLLLGDVLDGGVDRQDEVPAGDGRLDDPRLVVPASVDLVADLAALLAGQVLVVKILDAATGLAGQVDAAEDLGR